MPSQSVKHKHERELEWLPDQLRDNLTCGKGGNNSDPKELHTGSPISPLRTGTLNATTTTSSTSSSSGSFSGPASTKHSPKPPRVPDKNPKRNPGGYSVESSPSDARNGHTWSASDGSHSPSSAPVREGQTRSGSVGSHPAKSTASPRVVLPFFGNICPSGQIKTGMASRSTRSNVLSLGTGVYGYGNVVRGNVGEDLEKRIIGGVSSHHNDPDMFRGMANDCYSRGDFEGALSIYDQAISIAPRNAAYHFNRSQALIHLGRLMEAAEECEETLRLNPEYFGARPCLGSLLLRLGQVENARTHFCYRGQHQDLTAPHMLQKLQTVEKHLTRCSYARRADDWRIALSEINGALDSGADASPQLRACKAEALLKLHQLNDAFFVFSNVPDIATPADQSNRSERRIFGMLFETYILFVRSQIELAKGRFEDALRIISKARQKDPHSPDISTLFDKIKLVVQARVRGNHLYKTERFTEASIAYDEGLRLDPSNPCLISNRAACWYMLGKWERSAEDCELALRLQPNHTKSLMRRAAVNYKLERWQKAVTDYEALLKEFPKDTNMVEAYFHAQIELKKSLGEDVTNMKYGGKVESVSTLAQFCAAVSSIGAVIIHFKKDSSSECKRISQYLDTLRTKYPYANFLEVDIEKASEIAQSEKVKNAPMVMVYRKGKRVHDMHDPTPESLEAAATYFHRLTFK